MDLFSTLADWSSLIGLLVGIVGFSIAIIQIRQTKSAADAATNAATQARNAIARMSAIEACSAAVQQMEDIKGLHRRGDTNSLPEKYAGVRLKLAEIKGDLAESSHKEFIDATIQSYADMENEYDAALNKGIDTQNDFHKKNATISKQTTRMIEVISYLRKQV